MTAMIEALSFLQGLVVELDFFQNDSKHASLGTIVQLATAQQSVIRARAHHAIRER